jgi:hypothetical protein
MDFIISEEASAFSRDCRYTIKEDDSLTLFTSKMTLLSWKKMEKLSLENTDECSY